MIVPTGVLIASEKQSTSECETRMNSTLKDADLDDIARFDAMQQHVAEQVVFFEFAFSQTGGEVRTVNRNVELLQDVRQRAEMIFVTVREDNRGDVVAILFEKIEIGNGNIDAVSASLRESPCRRRESASRRRSAQPCNSSQTRRYRRAE